MSVADILVGAANICIDQGAGYADAGFTDGGITLRYEPEYLDVFADQAFGTVAKRKVDEKMFLEFELISLSLDNIRAAMTLPAENLSGTGGNRCLLLGAPGSACDEQTVVGVKMYGIGPDCTTRTYFFANATPSEGFELALSRTEAQKLSVTYEILKDSAGYFGLICDADGLVEDCDDVGDYVITDGSPVIDPPPAAV